jgi:RNA polymerase sigma-70 factor (ECF subfamily)
MWRALAESEEAIPEVTLVQQAVGGDGDAFTHLYDIYVERVYRHIAYRVRVVADVEDLTQEVFVRAWHAIRRYKTGQRPFLAWLYTIAHNLVIDYYRKKGRELLSPLEELPPRVSGQSDADTELFLDRDVVRRMLAQLPEDQQKVLMFRFVEGLDHAEVAAALGKSQGAVRVIQLRALRRLRQWLEGGEEKR